MEWRIARVGIKNLLRLKVILALFAGAQTALCTPADPGVITLIQLVDQRLSHMKDVAVYKWHNHLPIEDLAREKVVLNNAVSSAEELGLDPVSSEAFFVAQIGAAKAIQSGWFSQWQEENTTVPEISRDLVNDIRPELIRLGNQIISQMHLLLATDRELLSLSQSDSVVAQVKTEKLSTESKLRLLAAVSHMKLAPMHKAIPVNNRLALIKKAGTLRIGTTGDYAPFSLLSNGTLSGIDIELGKDLAAHLQVDYQFVSTSWPTLMEDLQKDKFDIGMSGISWNAVRQESAHFSIPYHLGGKTPISRCTDATRFDSLKKIDTQGTRIIVNPGGTNQKFVNRHIQQASIRVFENNTLIFDEIVANRADVMITDLIEVQLQSARHSALCASMGNRTLSHLEKAYLLPQDNQWKLVVDKWLFEHKQQGTLQQTFARHLH
jgi:cyclohexadienyl dehydratase